MFVRGLLALEERRRVGAGRVVRPYEWQRFALRDVGDAVPCGRYAAVSGSAGSCGCAGCTGAAVRSALSAVRMVPSPSAKRMVT